MRPPSHPNTPIIPSLKLTPIIVNPPQNRIRIQSASRSMSPTKAIRNASASHDLKLNIQPFPQGQNSDRINNLLRSARGERSDQLVINDFVDKNILNKSQRRSIIPTQQSIKLQISPQETIRPPQVKMLTKSEYQIMFMQITNDKRNQFIWDLIGFFKSEKQYSSNRTKITENIINNVEFLAEKSKTSGILQKNNSIQIQLAVKVLYQIKSDLDVMLSKDAEPFVNYISFIKWQNSGDDFYKIYLNEPVYTQNILYQAQSGIIHFKFRQ